MGTSALMGKSLHLLLLPATRAMPEVVNIECTGGFDFPIFSVILWTWKACLNMFGMIMAAKTWHCEDGVGEVRALRRKYGPQKQRNNT